MGGKTYWSAMVSQCAYVSIIIQHHSRPVPCLGHVEFTVLILNITYGWFNAILSIPKLTSALSSLQWTYFIIIVFLSQYCIITVTLLKFTILIMTLFIYHNIWCFELLYDFFANYRMPLCYGIYLMFLGNTTQWWYHNNLLVRNEI